MFICMGLTHVGVSVCACVCHRLSSLLSTGLQLDGLSVAQMKELRERAEKFTFQAEVNRMMKLIINSLYRNKEVCRGCGLQGRQCIICSVDTPTSYSLFT